MRGFRPKTQLAEQGLALGLASLTSSLHPEAPDEAGSDDFPAG
ncbi:MAG TPA: hypothetical protein VIT91_08955 [Chthoniobacterales bacterium]